MAYPKFPKILQQGQDKFGTLSGSRRITPQQQLWELTNERHEEKQRRTPGEGVRQAAYGKAPVGADAHHPLLHRQGQLNSRPIQQQFYDRHCRFIELRSTIIGRPSLARMKPTINRAMRPYRQRDGMANGMGDIGQSAQPRCATPPGRAAGPEPLRAMRISTTDNDGIWPGITSTQSIFPHTASWLGPAYRLL